MKGSVTLSALQTIPANINLTANSLFFFVVIRKEDLYHSAGEVKFFFESLDITWHKVKIFTWS